MTKQDWFVHAAPNEDVAVAKYDVAGGDGTVNAPVEKGVDLTKVVEDQGDVHVPAHIDEGRGAVEIHEAEDMARGDEVDNDVHTPVDDGGGTVHVKTPVGGGGGAIQVTEGDVMAKHGDNKSNDQVPVEEGVELTKMLGQLEVTQAREDVKEFLMAK